MGEALKRKDYLSLLSKTKQKKKRDLLIDYASKQDIVAIQEIVYNLMYGSIPLTSSQKRTLSKYQQTLREIIRKSTSVKHKKQVLKQEGGFLPTLIPIALSVLSSLL